MLQGTRDFQQLPGLPLQTHPPNLPKPQSLQASECQSGSDATMQAQLPTLSTPGNHHLKSSYCSLHRASIYIVLTFCMHLAELQDQSGVSLHCPPENCGGQQAGNEGVRPPSAF